MSSSFDEIGNIDLSSLAIDGSRSLAPNMVNSALNGAGPSCEFSFNGQTGLQSCAVGNQLCAGALNAHGQGDPSGGQPFASFPSNTAKVESNQFGQAVPGIPTFNASNTPSFQPCQQSMTSPPQFRRKPSTMKALGFLTERAIARFFPSEESRSNNGASLPTAYASNCGAKPSMLNQHSHRNSSMPSMPITNRPEGCSQHPGAYRTFRRYNSCDMGNANLPSNGSCSMNPSGGPADTWVTGASAPLISGAAYGAGMTSVKMEWNDYEDRAAYGGEFYGPGANPCANSK